MAWRKMVGLLMLLAGVGLPGQLAAQAHGEVHGVEIVERIIENWRYIEYWYFPLELPVETGETVAARTFTDGRVVGFCSCDLLTCEAAEATGEGGLTGFRGNGPLDPGSCDLEAETRKYIEGTAADFLTQGDEEDVNPAGPFRSPLAPAQGPMPLAEYLREAANLGPDAPGRAAAMQRLCPQIVAQFEAADRAEGSFSAADKERFSAIDRGCNAWRRDASRFRQETVSFAMPELGLPRALRERTRPEALGEVLALFAADMARGGGEGPCAPRMVWIPYFEETDASLFVAYRAEDCAERAAELYRDGRGQWRVVAHDDTAEEYLEAAVGKVKAHVLETFVYRQ